MSRLRYIQIGSPEETATTLRQKIKKPDPDKLNECLRDSQVVENMAEFVLNYKEMRKKCELTVYDLIQYWRNSRACFVFCDEVIFRITEDSNIRVSTIGDGARPRKDNSSFLKLHFDVEVYLLDIDS